MNRRSFITCCAWGMAGLALQGLPAYASSDMPDPIRPGSQLDKLVPSITPVISLRNAHTKEVVKKRFFGPDGYDRAVIEEINWMFRDWREDAAPQFDVRVLWALAATRVAAMKDGHSGDMILLSGFRTQKTNLMLRSKGIGAARNSFHLRAQASDIRLEGVPVKDVAAYARWLEVGGVGQYDNSRFVHYDSGPVRTWKG